jgi:hypothetical protein
VREDAQRVGRRMLPVRVDRDRRVEPRLVRGQEPGAQRAPARSASAAVASCDPSSMTKTACGSGQIVTRARTTSATEPAAS